MSECKCNLREKLVGDGCEVCNPAKSLEYAKETIEELTQQRDALLEAVKKYADRQNWGYYDDSGCDKGHGEYTDACFIGPEVAQAAIAAVEGEK